jgi:hypothetical protein
MWCDEQYHWLAMYAPNCKKCQGLPPGLCNKKMWVCSEDYGKPLCRTIKYRLHALQVVRSDRVLISNHIEQTQLLWTVEVCSFTLCAFHYSLHSVFSVCCLHQSSESNFQLWIFVYPCVSVLSPCLCHSNPPLTNTHGVYCDSKLKLWIPFKEPKTELNSE